MPAELAEKVERYERLLADAVAEPAPPEGTPLREAAADCAGMAASYLDDGRHFRASDDPVNALAAFSYGHAWLDCGVRIGLLAVADDADVDADLFAA